MADINRGTFYLHYRDVYDLLASIEDDMFRQFNGILERNTPSGEITERPSRLILELFSFIREKRQEGMPVEYGCSHYLGTEYEHEVREWYFLCSAGIYVASIMANGDIAACLDIERRPELIQGNILRDDFTEVWKHGFQVFRKPLSDRNSTCRACPEKDFCAGDAHHSWNYDEDRPRLCFRDILF